MGIWDVLDKVVGTKVVTTNTSIPWVVLTRTRVGVAVHTSGKVQLQIGAATLEAAKQVEALLMSIFGAQWLADKDTHLLV